MSDTPAIRPDSAMANAPPAFRLLEMATNADLDVEKLKALADLYEREQARAARTEFHAALALFQEECPAVTRDKETDYVTKKGGRVRYSYASLEHIVGIVRPVLSRHGLSFSWDCDESQDGKLVVTCTLQHVGGHSESSRFIGRIDREAYMSEMQKSRSAWSYARRTALESVLGLTATDEDDDGGGGAQLDTISPEQVAALEALLPTPEHRKRFLKYAVADTLADITTAAYGPLLAALERKAKTG